MYFNLTLPMEQYYSLWDTEDIEDIENIEDTMADTKLVAGFAVVVESTLGEELAG